MQRLLILAESLRAEVIRKSEPADGLGDAGRAICGRFADVADANRKSIAAEMSRAELVAVSHRSQNTNSVGVDLGDRRLKSGGNRDPLPSDRPPILHPGHADVVGRNRQAPRNVPQQVLAGDVPLFDP